MLRKIIKRILAAFLDWLQVPGASYLRERYIYQNGAHVFPARNLDMLSVGIHTSLHNVIINLWAPVVLEDEVSIAHNALLLTGGHELSARGFTDKVIPRGPITIKKGAWIGSNAIVLGGVTVGEGSILAAGSVLTKSIPLHEIWAGNPARKVRDFGRK